MRRTRKRSSGAATRRRSAGLVLLAATAAIVPSGCGGASSPSVATVATTGTGPAASTNAGGGGGATPGASPSQAQQQQDALKFSQCMRANGLPGFPDPSAGGGIEIPVGSGIDPTSPAFQRAQARCRKLVPGGGIGPAPGSTTHPSAQTLAHWVNVAHCMRRHGISQFPDPGSMVPAHPFADPNIGVISVIDGVVLVFPSTLDTRSTPFVRAANACRFPLHNH